MKNAPPGGDFGVLGREKSGIFFLEEYPSSGGIFGGMGGENEAPCVKEIPPERARTGAVLEGENGEKWVQKRAYSNELLQTL